jgi:hypothetical protein
MKIKKKMLWICRCNTVADVKLQKKISASSLNLKPDETPLHELPSPAFIRDYRRPKLVKDH